MKKVYFSMTVDDVGLDGWCKVSNLVHLMEFFQSEKMPASFHVVPIDEATNKPFYTLDKSYISVIQDGAKNGFDFEQHGLRHNRFELGIPPAMVLNLPHEAENKRWVAENREFLAKDHSVENCRKRLKEGRLLLEDCLGFAIKGFRAPAAQESPGMFAALRDEGYEWDSSCILQETGWDYIMGQMDVPPREITVERYNAMRAKSYGLSLPMTCDYTWYLTKEKYAKTMALAIRDFCQCGENDIPFVTVCHVDPVHDGEGLRFLHEFYEKARESAQQANWEIEFVTLKQLAGILNK